MLLPRDCELGEGLIVGSSAPTVTAGGDTTSHLWHFVIAMFGVGLTLAGSLMLFWPELFQDRPLDPNTPPHARRMDALALIFFGVCALLLVFVYGLAPCGPDECTAF